MKTDMVSDVWINVGDAACWQPSSWYWAEVWCEVQGCLEDTRSMGQSPGGTQHGVSVCVCGGGRGAASRGQDGSAGRQNMT